jgi:lipopolysaccharide/colanic/teichoic acid biosynthesis glycosyltransferase
VSGRSELSWAETVRLDVRYVDRWSLGLDLLIMLRTPVAVMSRRGAY